MSKIRKILRMYSQGRSIMSISAQSDASRNTVKKYLASFKDSGFTIYSGEVDHVIPWQTDQAFTWRKGSVIAVEALSKVVI